MYHFFKSMIDEDKAPVVICDLEHIVIYMNPSAEKNYEKHGGKNLIGKSLLNCHNKESQDIISKVVLKFGSDKNCNRIHTFYNAKQNKDVYMIALRNEENELIGYYEKHEFREKDNTPFYENI